MFRQVGICKRPANEKPPLLKQEKSYWLLHLTNARLYQEARLTSLTDALTEVVSRKLFEDKLEAECARAKRYERPFCAGIIDLDNFKTINDILGSFTGVM